MCVSSSSLLSPSLFFSSPSFLHILVPNPPFILPLLFLPFCQIPLKKKTITHIGWAVSRHCNDVKFVTLCLVQFQIKKKKTYTKACTRHRWAELSSVQRSLHHPDRQSACLILPQYTLKLSERGPPSFHDERHHDKQATSSVQGQWAYRDRVRAKKHQGHRLRRARTHSLPDPPFLPRNFVKGIRKKSKDTSPPKLLVDERRSKALSATPIRQVAQCRFWSIFSRWRNVRKAYLWVR